MQISYIDLSEDEIVHWKYIKRTKMSNGKWRYYYDESNLTSQKAEADKATAEAWRNKSAMISAQKSYGAAQTAKIIAATRYDNLRKSGTAKYSEVRAAKDAYNVADHKDKVARIKASAAKTKYNSSAERAEKLVKKYERKKLISLPRRTISSGIVAVNNWLVDRSR